MAAKPTSGKASAKSNIAGGEGEARLQAIRARIDALVAARGDEIDWSETLLMADRYGVRPPLYYVLGQAAQLCGTPIPPRLLAALAPSQRDVPAENDWGDIVPQLLTRPVVNRFQLA